MLGLLVTSNNGRKMLFNISWKLDISLLDLKMSLENLEHVLIKRATVRCSFCLLSTKKNLFPTKKKFPRVFGKALVPHLVINRDRGQHNTHNSLGI